MARQEAVQAGFFPESLCDRGSRPIKPPGPSCALCATARGDREQEVVQLNSKVPVRDELNRKQKSLEVTI
jgi:hypothetical protein